MTGLVTGTGTKISPVYHMTGQETMTGSVTNPACLIRMGREKDTARSKSRTEHGVETGTGSVTDPAYLKESFHSVS
jgi:hypothetical protein